jgi:hypothetical protein
MIDINLLPEELKKKESTFKKIDLSAFRVGNKVLIRIGFITIGVLTAITLLLLGVKFIQQGRLSSLSKRNATRSPLLKEAQGLKSRANMINRKVASIDELMVKRFVWAKKLNDLSDSMVLGVWLTDLEYTEKMTEVAAPDSEAKAAEAKSKKDKSKPIKVLSKYLVMSGYASSKGEEGAATVGKFIKSLKENNSFYADFSDIELGGIKRDQIEGQDVMSFKITCLFKEAK